MPNVYPVDYSEQVSVIYEGNTPKSPSNLTSE